MKRHEKLILRSGLLVILFSLLTVLMLQVFGDPSLKAQNTRTLSQLHQYMTALELYRSEKNIYPTTDSLVCLGDYGDDACWDEEGKGVREDFIFNDLLDGYLPILPAGKMVVDEDDASLSREGYVYLSKNSGKGYEIEYMLTGRMHCGFGEDLSLTVFESTGSNTLCSIVR
jgi:hypothetical protein